MSGLGLGLGLGLGGALLGPTQGVAEVKRRSGMVRDKAGLGVCRGALHLASISTALVSTARTVERCSPDWRTLKI